MQPPAANDPLCILTVHAHPDDEASKGAGTIAKYQAEGVRTVLVCCTGGEEGDILNPEMDRPEVTADLAAWRRKELDAAAKIIGYDKVEMLGYRDSGMKDSPSNEHPDCFAQADLDEAIGRLVAIIRRDRPQVMVTYPEDQGRYQHPDHLRVWDICRPAFDLAGDPEAYVDAGDPWTPQKLYSTTWSKARITARHEAFLHAGIDSPYDEGWFAGEDKDHLISAKIDIAGFHSARIEGLRAHATQVDPNSSFWFGLPPDVEANTYPYDDYLLIESRIDTEETETDLFAGLRVAAVQH